MERTLSTQLPKSVGKQVLIKGWLHNLRELGKINFLILRDRGGLVQVVVEDKKEIDKLKGAQVGSILTVTGEVKSTQNTELGVEITQPEIEVVNKISEVSPLVLNKEDMELDLDTLLDERVIALRHPKQQAIFRIQQGVKEGFRKAMKTKEFTEISSPKLLAEASEGGTNFFKVPYFDGANVFLAQSPQFYKQMMVGVFERVFEIGPVFRAEKHNTSRHMSEYVSLDAEMGFIDSWEDILDLIEYAIKEIIQYVWDNYEADLRLLGATKPLIEAKVPRLKITEIHDIVFKETGKDFRAEPDLEPEEERFICEYSAKEWNSDLVLATHFPTKKRPFYTYPSDENPEETYSGDMLFRGVEIVTGGRRITDYTQLVANATKWGVDLEKIRDYLQAFKFGMPAEGGFGMGLERVTAKIIGLHNVKEASLFVTDLKRAGGTKLAKRVINGGANIRDAIVAMLKEREIKFTHMEHEETPTSEDSARVRGAALSEGAKALILAGKQSGTNVMLVVPGDKKADFKALEEVVGEKLEMEKPDKIQQKFGLQIGGVPPYGNLFGLKVYMDEAVAANKVVSFNCGLRTESISMSGSDLAETTEASVGNFSA
ncbi:MAG: aspartate--tRNA(Asn) ligase [Candidatus Doudnabacteria bacterium]|nr:aspartate--tRNA(Asn) ligase [Candidatus Doudnabacteria bacterium]